MGSSDCLFFFATISPKHQAKMSPRMAAMLVIFLAIWTLAAAAPAEENMLNAPQDRGCGNAYAGCCDCSRKGGWANNGKCMIDQSTNYCRAGFKCVCDDSRIGFGLGYCAGLCKK